MFKVLFISPEVVPFAKTGGLADVAGALPKALSQAGIDIKVIMPYHKTVNDDRFKIKDLHRNLNVEINRIGTDFHLKHLADESINVEHIFIDCPKCFNRESLYINPKTGKDWKDNDERFILFAKASLIATKRINFKPDIVHCNDWQSAMVIAYLKTLYESDEFFNNVKTLYSIHNLAYQGNFPEKSFKKLGIDKGYWQPLSPFEYWGKLSFMKAGISFADIINTVSKTYAEEIQSTDEYGFGMEGLLKDRSDDLYGIINGIDYSIWNPEIDSHIPHLYSHEKFSGKKQNKTALLKETGLEKTGDEMPIIGIISRLADQKGFDLIAEIADELLSLDLKIVLLGTGEKKYHNLFKKLMKKYPDKISVNLTFNNRLAHMIEAGSDMFLMPSRYEPCGLNQLYSLKYGTIPIVRKTGGLADTIIDYDDKSDKIKTGFVFDNYDSKELLKALKRAINIFKNPKEWELFVKSVMTIDYSWEKSAKEYINLYTKAMNR
ncbi:MAG: glycogen synthase GlgA [candidate division Zixibacteria bacterium]|nr:glycogen synthase GlgA [candidate division Zixibacteria bacterium]